MTLLAKHACLEGHAYVDWKKWEATATARHMHHGHHVSFHLFWQFAAVSNDKSDAIVDTIQQQRTFAALLGTRAGKAACPDICNVLLQCFEAHSIVDS